MPVGDYGPGAFTAQVGMLSVQYKLKGMSHAEALAELECIAYPCELGKDCRCQECEIFRMHPTSPDFHPIDHTVNICEWLDREEIQQDRREALRRIKTREVLEKEARATYEERRLLDPTLPYVPPMVLDNPERLEHRWVLVFRATAARGTMAYTHMEEVWSMCVRMWEEGLYLSHRMSKDMSFLYVTVAANADLMKEEAAKRQLPMRLKETMGMVKYQASFQSYFVEMANNTVFNRWAIVCPFRVRCSHSSWMLVDAGVC
jgi:hypothetical protein